MLNNLIPLQEAGGSAGMMNLIMIVALIAIFYFFMIRPQQRKQKEIRKFREGLNVGDRVITAGGIYGKIRAVKENTITLEIADNVRISIDKGSVYPSAAQAQESANDSAK
ncbi:MULTISPECIES: preprotein translocase subunit YajC [Muribaculum]|jgi:preprotein translocase subunit YajC|uniref:Sec translocon accessory complex subunit YajC n=3 Tax=Muribaculum TaxID=1918540 RepID=A0A4P7VF15_9BACT|nr:MULTISPECIES: preprotein translocase subunit YajC [Muribaculum]MCX4278992.1 preprotein translocase subunit YajC [Muribaculum sp.]QCD35233.1 preprotein translocase subunit YajC [Muribaculum gordoncarteri]